jgi:hypothetical protein
MEAFDVDDYELVADDDDELIADDDDEMVADDDELVADDDELIADDDGMVAGDGLADEHLLQNWSQSSRRRHQVRQQGPYSQPGYP